MVQNIRPQSESDVAPLKDHAIPKRTGRVSIIVEVDICIIYVVDEINTIVIAAVISE